MLDTRNWSFAKKALWELKQEKKSQNSQQHSAYHHYEFYYWVKVRLLSHNKKHKKLYYQLPNDLQFAMHQHAHDHPHDNGDLLTGALINVPVSKYHSGKVKLTVGQIKKVILLPARTHNPRWITRSQFAKIDNPWYRWAFQCVDATKTINFLTHDFSLSNQQRITQAVQKYVKSEEKRVSLKFWFFVFFGVVDLIAALALLIFGARIALWFALF